MKIAINKHDIFRYVVGNTLRHPIECCIDFEDRYEAMQFGIYDHLTKKVFEQNALYKEYYSIIECLKSSSKFVEPNEIESHCEKIPELVLEVNID